MSDKELLSQIGMTEEEAEARGQDSWDAAKLGKPRRGRPSIASEEVRPFTVRFPVSLMAYVEDRARAHGHTRSEELRRIVAEAKSRASV